MSKDFAPRSGRRVLVRALGGALLVVALVFLTGCPGSKDSANSVSGKVTLKSGEKVSGLVVFVGPDNKEYTTPVKPDGTYTLSDPPIGKVKVLVKSMGLGVPAAGKIETKEAGGSMPSTSGGAAPPAKYAMANTSDLTYEVKPGKQTYDIELTP